MAITPKKKPDRIYMTDDNSGVIYSDKQGNVISKDEAMKNFRDSASAEKREKRRSSQYKGQRKKSFLDKVTNKLNKAGEAYKNLGQAGLNVLRGDVKGQPYEKKNKGGEMKKKRYNRQGMEYDRPVKEGEFNLRNKPKVIKVKSGGEMKKAGLNVGETLKQFKDLMTGSKDSKMSKQKENLKKQITEGRAKMRDEAKVKYKDGGLTGGQKKLDVNNDGKISGEDFKILKGKNNKMRGGGIAIKGNNFKGVF